MRLLGANGAGVGLTARSIWQRRWLSLVVFLTASIAAAAAAIGPMYTEAARTAILRNAFAQAPVDAQGIMFVWDRPYQTPPGFLDETPDATGIPQAFNSPIRGAEITSHLLDQADRVSLIWRQGSCARLVIVSGRCPSSAGEVVASEASSRRYGWEIGAQVFLRALVPPNPPGGADKAEEVEPLPLTVVGIYEPRDPEERFWFGRQYFSHSTATSEGNVAAGLRNDPLLTEEATLEWSARADALWEVSSTLLLEVESLVGDDAESLHAVPKVAREWAAGQVREWAGTRAVVSSSMSGIGAEAIREQKSLDVSVIVVSLELVGLIWLLLFLAVNDLVRARQSEIGLARLRGLSRLQVWRFGLGGPVTLLVLALPVGVLASKPIVKLLSGWLLGSDVEVSTGWSAWLAAAAGILGGLLAAVLAARSTLTMSVMEQWRNPRSGERRSWVVDAVVITLVVTGLVELMSGGIITEPSGESMTALLAPALIAIALALLVARGLPHLGRLAYRATDRRSGIGFFLGLRHASRSPDTTSMLVVLTVAFSLATFALTAWAVTVRNHRDVAMAHNGAPTVLFVTPPENTSLIDIVNEADPGGQSAVPVAVYDRTEARLLAVDTTRFSSVANWRPEFTEVPLADLLPLLRPPSSPQIMLSGDELQISIDPQRVNAPNLELFADLELPDRQTRVGVPLKVSAQGEEGTVLRTGLPSTCRNTCELRGITVLASADPDGGTFRAELLITKIEIHSDTGWRTVDAGLAEADGWRGEGSSFRVPAETTATPNGLVLTFETGDVARAVVATHPPIMPAITLGAIGPRPVGHEVGGMDGGIQEVEAVADAQGLPGAIGPTALVDYETAERTAFGFTSDLELQVWVTSEAAALVKQNLQDQGALITAERTASDLERQFNGEGPGLALALLLVMAAAGAVLAMARAGISLYAAGRQRSHQFAVLSAIGASERAQRAAILIEQTITLGAGVLAGAVAGIGSAVIALRRIPQFTTPPATPPLTFTPDPLVIAGALGISAVAVTIVVVLTTEAIRRSVDVHQLRQAAP